MKNDVLIDDQKKKSLTVTNLIWMGFTVVWGFGNVVNNYANQGLAVITSWIFIMALYFIPYSLMVGELGSTFKEGQSGLSYWIKQTMGPLLAYFVRLDLLGSTHPIFSTKTTKLNGCRFMGDF